MEVTGTIIEIFETQEISDKFKKRELILKTNDQYPQELSIQLTQDRCDIIEKYDIVKDDFVKVSINLRGREWTSPKGERKWFNTIDAWKIENLNEGQPTREPVKEEVPQDDLPF